MEAEAKRAEMKRQAQEWAGTAQDPNSDLFVFVGRWTKQKGVNLIADIMPSMYVFRFIAHTTRRADHSQTGLGRSLPFNLFALALLSIFMHASLLRNWRG